MEGNVICPYPGLRPFNEDEAIFFKGREEHIEQIVKQLEEKKFLMLTGASGDGKSSLVYAGVIPNARAGFFKAKFNNWIVADFRPEREPLTNMASTINEELKIGDAVKVEKEFSYGFSALIDLYKSSVFWIDQQSENFRQLTADEQKKAKRKGANLLILVDQFEEFFTNPENYHNGKTSIESQAVVNLLLETTRLSIEQDLPIYIVCTMRSDYIGQCASFRGLPEYIGYSQFFVPRLKRQEIYQVIEEPAQLNGNKISKRLVEMLINEMNDGIDQLPVLQHALNQIWQKAERGQVEMDLIHFAKINGIPQRQLPASDQVEFEKWFDSQAEFKKKFFKNPSLGAVLDAHANELYESADTPSGLVSKVEAKLIVETTFKCLTKIDEARAVRNRMSLQEVTRIINQPHITTSIVARVLEVFRIQGNTFLKPFIFDIDHAHELNDDSVLDITHESLIRNWNLLSNWAQEEYESYLTWQDFNKQLQRWINSGKSSGYLLPIGPLTFFETWYNGAKPSKYLLARYDDTDMSKEQKIEEAGETLKHAKLFIKRSARRLFFSRTVLKYGADKLIAAFGILLLVFSCTYFYFDFRKKQNDYVLDDLQEKGSVLLKSKYPKSRVKADYIISAERLNPGVFRMLLQNIESDSAQLEVGGDMLASCLGYQEAKSEKEINNPLLGSLFVEQLNMIESKGVLRTSTSLVRNINTVLVAVYSHIMIKRNNYPVNDNGAYQKFCDNTFSAYLMLLKDTAVLRKMEIDQFNKLFETMPEIVDYDSLRLKQIADLLDPFNPITKPIFDIPFPRGKTVAQYWNGFITHNAGYYHLANLFALTSDFKKLNQCLDSILVNNKDFLIVTYGYTYDRLLNDLVITNKLFSKEGNDFRQRIESKLAGKTNYSVDMIMLNNLLSNKLDVVGWTIRRIKIHKPWDLQVQWEKISYKQLNDLAENVIENILKNGKLAEDEKNFMAALIYKAKAFANNKKENYNAEQISVNIGKALNAYKKISPAYCKGDINIGEGTDIKTFSRAKVFKFPFLVSLTEKYYPFEIYEWRTRSYKNKSIFMDYLANENNLADFYFRQDEDAENLNNFLLNYYNSFKFNKPDEHVMSLKPFEEMIKNNTIHKNIDRDALLAFITSYYHSTRDSKSASFYAGKINIPNFLNKEKINKNDNSAKYYILSKSLLNYYLEQPYSLVINVDGSESKGESRGFDSAFSLLKHYPDAYQKRNALISNIDSLQKGKKDALAVLLMDTLLNGYIAKTTRFGNKFFELLGRISTNAGDKIAMVLMKDRPDNVKPLSLNFFVSGRAHGNSYYQATTFIPEYVSSSTQLTLYATIYKNEVKRRKVNAYDGWSVMDNPNEEDWITYAYESTQNEGLFIQED